MSVPPKWNHIPVSSAQPQKGVLVPPLREPTLPSVPKPVLIVDHSPGPCLPSYPWYVLAYPSHLDTATSTKADSDVLHHQYRLSVLQWNRGQARRNPTKIIAANGGRFHAVIPQEASDHVPHVSDQFIPYTGDTDLAILLNKDTFEPNAAVLAFHESTTSRTRGAWWSLWFEDFYDALPFRAPHGHVLLCSHSQCGSQETRCLH